MDDTEEDLREMEAGLRTTDVYKSKRKTELDVCQRLETKKGKHCPKERSDLVKIFEEDGFPYSKLALLAKCIVFCDS